MLNIVLPMAGRGSRFATAGYKDPKPFIKVCGEPMIKVVVDNLTPNCEHRFIFICQKEHLDKYDGRQLLNSIAKDPVIIEISEITEGQLSTALLAKKFINNDQPLLTANTDQYIDFDVNSYIEDMQTRCLDGSIMTMRANDAKWSYAKIDTKTNLVVQTAEKRVISDNATVGIYGFGRGKDFCRAAEFTINNNLRTNGEFYICPVYNYLINEGSRIGIYDIGAEGQGMYGLGTPADLESFLKTPVAKFLREKYENNCA